MSRPVVVTSLCIPRVFANITEERIRSIFDKLDIIELSKIEIVKSADEKFNRVYIHINKWKSTDNGKQVRKCVTEGKEFKIVYDDPWFWKISAYRNNNNNSRPHVQEPRIVFDDDNKKKRKFDKNNTSSSSSSSNGGDTKKTKALPRAPPTTTHVKVEKEKEKEKEKKEKVVLPPPTPPPPPPTPPPALLPQKVVVVQQKQDDQQKQDEEITCKQCSNVFLFTVQNQEFYQSKGFYLKPLRCKDCAKSNSVIRTANAAAAVQEKFEPKSPTSSPPRIIRKTTILFVEEEEE